MGSRYVQIFTFCPQSIPDSPQILPLGLLIPKKIHRPNPSGNSGCGRAHLFGLLLMQVKCRKTNFKHWRRYPTTLKPCSFNINRRKTFRLFRFSNLSDHTQSHFRPRPILTGKIMKNAVFGALHPFFDIENMPLQYKPYKVTLFNEGLRFL